MKTIAIIIFFVAFFIAKFFQKKASKFLKEDYKNKFYNKFTRHPISYSNDAYFDKQGRKYKNLGLITLFIGFILFVLLLSLSN